MRAADHRACQATARGGGAGSEAAAALGCDTQSCGVGPLAGLVTGKVGRIMLQGMAAFSSLRPRLIGICVARHRQHHSLGVGVPNFSAHPVLLGTALLAYSLACARLSMLTTSPQSIT